MSIRELIQRALDLFKEMLAIAKERPKYLPLCMALLLVIILGLLSLVFPIHKGLQGALYVIYVAILVILISDSNKEYKRIKLVIFTVVAILFLVDLLISRFGIFWKPSPDVAQQQTAQQVTKAQKLLEDGQFVEALGAFELLYRTNNESRFEVAEGYGVTLFELCRFDEAEPPLRKAVELSLKGLPATNYILACNNLGQLLQEKGSSEAGKLMEKALSEARLWSDGDPRILAIQENNFGTFLLGEGGTSNLARAESLFLDALAIDTNFYKLPDLAIAVDYNNLEELYRKQADYARAEDYALKAINCAKSSPGGALSPDYANSLCNYGLLCFAQTNYVMAVDFLEQARAVHEVAGPKSPSVASDENNLAEVLQSQREFSQAEALLKSANDIDKKCYGTFHRIAAMDDYNLGSLYVRMNHHRDAYEVLNANLKVYEKISGPSSSDVRDVLRRLVKPMRALGMTNEADACLERARKIAALNISEQTSEAQDTATP